MIITTQEGEIKNVVPKNLLELFISSKTRRKIIVIFTKYPDFRMHVRGLAKLIKEDPGNVQRELKRLEEVGFVTVTKEGNSRVYVANPKFVLYRDLQAMVLKSQASTRAPKAPESLL